MKTYRIGIVGCGQWAANYIKSINQMLNVELVCAMRKTDVRPDFLPHKCLFFTEQQSNKFYKLCKGVDGIIVATDEPWGPSAICLTQNIPVMAEKPLLTSTKQIQLFSEFASGRKLMVNYIHLFSDPFQELKKIVGNNKIVRVCSSGFGPSKTREHFSSLWDYGPHDLSMILTLLNSEPTEIDIQTHNKSKAGHSFIINLRFGDIKTKSIVGNGTIVKSRYLSVTYLKDGKENSVTYDDTSAGKLFLNGKPLNFVTIGRPLENSIKSFLELIDGIYDDRHGAALTAKITKILDTYEEQ